MQTKDEHLYTSQGTVEQQRELLVGLHAHEGYAEHVEIRRQRPCALVQRQQIGVGVRQERDPLAPGLAR